MPYFIPISPDDPYRSRIRHTRTDQFQREVQAQDKDDLPFDFTGSTFKMEIKEFADGSAVVTIPDGSFSLSQSQDAIDEGQGKQDIFTISHPPTDFADLTACPFEYYFDIQITDAAGKPYTPILGAFIIRAD